MDYQKSNKTHETSEISFRPLTEGLGFHPFSDGLPYAPVAKNPRSNLSLQREDTVAAGLPKVAFPVPRPSQVIPQISVPVAKRSSEFEKVVPSSTLTLAKLTPKESVLHSREKADLEGVGHLGYGYLVRRILAYFIDLFLNIFVCGIGVSCFVWSQEWSYELFSNTGVIFVMILFVGFFNWIFIAFQEVVFKTSFGKRIFCLSFQGSSSWILLRALFFLPSLGILGLGLIWSLFDRQKRCWHDQVTGIQPYLKIR